MKTYFYIMTPVGVELKNTTYFKIGITPKSDIENISLIANPFNRIGNINKGNQPNELKDKVAKKELQWNWQIYCFWEFNEKINKAKEIENSFRDAVDKKIYPNGINRLSKKCDYYQGLIESAVDMSKTLISLTPTTFKTVNAL